MYFMQWGNFINYANSTLKILHEVILKIDVVFLIVCYLLLNFGWSKVAFK